MKVYQFKELVTDQNVVVEVKVNTKMSDGSKDKFTLKLGQEYVVKPDNKQKKKHRDRRIIIHKFLEDGRASVKFKDSNRVGKVDLEDIKPEQ